MAFERLSRLFRRKKKEQTVASAGESPPVRRPSDQATLHAEVASPEEERGLLIEQLDDGFKLIGTVLDRLQDNLGRQAEVMNSFQRTMDQLPRMIDEISAGAAANRNVVTALQQHATHKEQVEQNMLVSLQEINQSIREERQGHQDQVTMVVNLHRSQRRFLVFLVVVFGFVAIVLLALVLVLALNRDLLSRLLGTQAPVPTDVDRRPTADPGSAATPGTTPRVWTATVDELLDKAAASADPRIRDHVTRQP
jgi:hypothetical protein